MPSFRNPTLGIAALGYITILRFVVPGNDFSEVVCVPIPHSSTELSQRLRASIPDARIGPQQSKL